MIGVVPGIFHARWQCASRRLPMSCRRRLLKCFMWSFLVIMATEPVEASLLLGRCRSSRLGRLCLQYTVHPLMTTLVLRPPWWNLSPFHAALEPRHRQRREHTSTRRPERRSVVGTYGVG